MRILIYDIELAKRIVTGVDPNNPPPGYSANDCVFSWDDHHLMTPSVLCAPTYDECAKAATGAELYEAANARYFTMTPFDRSFGMEQAQSWLDEHDLLVSFNGLGFDNKVLRAHGVHVPTFNCYDILQKWKQVTGKRISLDALAQVNLGKGKSGNGGDAPILWLQGKKREVIEYCFQDCLVTAHLFRLIEGRGWLFDGAQRKVELPKPECGQKGLFR